ncbi:unnamed protein product [Dracunculus medinensis]|uniref:SH2 domain-containing protein n=1 Tax=Dracunculus medinensis TaxID=318479 RepID=A0A0N4U4D6_DRAME|nr:unnamed protein product [Dracunculus medinensis]
MTDYDYECSVLIKHGGETRLQLNDESWDGRLAHSISNEIKSSYVHILCTYHKSEILVVIAWKLLVIFSEEEATTGETSQTETVKYY